MTPEAMLAAAIGALLLLAVVFLWPSRRWGLLLAAAVCVVGGLSEANAVSTVFTCPKQYEVRQVSTPP